MVYSGRSYSEAESGWECEAGYYACFKDCCQRIHHFCNLNTQRCQSCSTRSMYCGNDSLPLECDAWCLLQNCSDINTAHTGFVSSAYWWSTFTLLFILAFVMLGIIIRLVRNCKVFHDCQGRGGTDSEVSTLLTDSFEVLKVTEIQEKHSDVREWISPVDGNLDDKENVTVKKEETSRDQDEKPGNSGKQDVSCRQLPFSGNTDVLHNIPPTSCDVHPISIHTGFSPSNYSQLYKNQ